MHYLLNNSILIKTENAALSTFQTNKNILNYISTLPEHLIALDYGCGKLRHTIPLSQKVEKLTAIDSDIQLRRLQKINGIKSSVVEYIQTYMKNTVACPLETYEWQKKQFDFILCSNVLSAIPHLTDREIVLKGIRYMLKSSGKALISVQYRNSYFDTYEKNPKAERYLDGWLIRKRDQIYTFYALIDPDQLKQLCILSGLYVESVKKSDGSVYFEVSSEYNAK